MKYRIILFVGLFLMFAASGYAVNFTRDAGDPNWSNLDQWNDNSSGSYQDATNFPTSNDTVLLNGGRVLALDTNAAINTLVAPNATTDAFVEFVSGGALTATSFRVGNSSQAGNGTVNHFDGSLVATTLSLRPTGTKTGTYNLSGGTVTATNLEIGNSDASATGTATFVQSGGSVVSPDITIGGSGSGTCEISGGSLNATGTFDIITNGLLKVAGTSAVVTAATLDTEPGSGLAFSLDASGISTVQVSGSMSLTNASILVDGSSYWGDATNFVLMEAGTLSTMAGTVSITGLVNATVSQVGDSVVLSVVESKTTAVFENTTGDGLWSTPSNWSPAGVPSGPVLARIDNGLTATIAETPPVVAGIIVGNNATLVVQADLTATELRFGTQGTLKLVLSQQGLSPVSVAGGVTWDPAGQLVIDGNAYEGMDGYFSLVLSDNLPAGLTNNVSFTGFDEREPAVVVQDDGLWLRLVEPLSLSERLCSLIPESTVAAVWSNSQFTASRAYEPSGSAWSLSLEEAHVMDARLSHMDPGSSVRSWDLRVARGGNIYSLRTDALGETVPPSYRSDGDTSPWNDEVWQAVAVDRSQNDTANGNPYFMHQSGVYQKDPVLKKPFYSPQVAAWMNETDRSYTTINWTPQAHINIYVDGNPTNDVKSYLLMFTRYRDLGEGIIEVTQGDYNYGPDTLDFLNMPWGGVRRTTTEYAFLSEPGGTTWTEPETNGFGSVTQKYDLTGGWMGFSATSNGVTPSLGFVFGEDHETPLPNQDFPYSTFRWGYAGGKASYQSGETNWRNYFVTSCIRWYNLTQGNGFWSRYYFAMGDDLQDLSDRIAARQLVDAQLMEFNYTETTSPLLGYSISGSGTGFQCLETTGSADFFLYAYPVNDSFPIFEVVENDGSRYLTWNPYANGIVKPYDGTIIDLRLLGFALQTADVAGSSYAYESLDSILAGGGGNYLADGKMLSVRTATSLETWRVEHFGFTDDAGDGANLANPDGDAANNLYEYGVGGNPTNPADIGYLPTGGIYDAGGVTNFFEYVYARRTTPGHGLLYTVESTDDLVSGSWTNSGAIELPMTGNLDADFEAVTNRIDTVGKTNEFIRLKIEAL
jgi:hypothetical protein